MTIFGYIALLMIIAGWAMQFASVSHKKPELNISFVLLYTIGVFILVFDSLSSGQISVALLNLSAGIISALVLYRISR